MAAASVDDQQVRSELGTTATAVDRSYTDAHLNTAISTLRSRSKATSRSAKVAPAAAGPKGPTYEQMISAFATITFSYVLLGVHKYVESVVSLFHLAYFSYRNPAVSKDLIKTAFHLLKTSYDNNLLTIAEIFETTNHSIIKPMARQNKQYFTEENHRTAHLQTMKTSSAVSRQ